MSSFIFHSRSKVLVLCAVMVAGVLAAVGYTFFLNPELVFWKTALSKKLEWEKQLRAKKQPLYVFCGGSSTAFQLDNQVLTEQFQLPSVNAGFHAGMGLDGVVALGSSMLQSKDYLVLMVEPSMLADGGGKMLPLGSQMMLHHPSEEAFFQEKIRKAGGLVHWGACRPGLYHAVTMLGKIAMKKPLYRYKIDEIENSGFLTTMIREDFTTPFSPAKTWSLSPQAYVFLKELKTWAEQKSVRLLYALPIAYVSPQELTKQREVNEAFLKQVNEVIPALRDEYLGASSEAGDFADTGQHMTADAAKKRTAILAESLKRFLDQ